MYQTNSFSLSSVTFDPRSQIHRVKGHIDHMTCFGRTCVLFHLALTSSISLSLRRAVQSSGLKLVGCSTMSAKLQFTKLLDQLMGQNRDGGFDNLKAHIIYIQLHLYLPLLPNIYVFALPLSVWWQHMDNHCTLRP